MCWPRRRRLRAVPESNIAIFGLFVAVTIVIVLRVSNFTKTATDYYAAGRSFTGRQNGVAIAGDYLSAASFLGITGAIALAGYDGFLYSIGFLVAWLVALLLVAELLRNTGKFTMADVLSFRMRQRPVRTAAVISTLAVSFLYLLAQMAGAGGLVSLLLISGAAVMTVWVLSIYGFSLSNVLGAAVDNSPDVGEALLAPGVLYGGPRPQIGFISLSLALCWGRPVYPTCSCASTRCRPARRPGARWCGPSR